MMKKLAAFLSAAGISLLGAASLPEGVFSESYRECRIISIQDQAMSMPGGLFRSIDPRGTFRADESYAASLNVFVIRHEESGRIALIDAGFGREKSRLLMKLAEIGISPATVGDVFITHMHPDHTGGLLTPAGLAAFPNAKIHIARQEYEAWKSDKARAGLARDLAPYREKIVLEDYGKALAPYGLVPLLYPGHTPGHTVYSLKVTCEKGSARTIWFVGDIVHAADLQIPHPEFCARFDKEPETAVKSRREMLKNAPFWYGAHLPFPGIVRIGSTGDGFTFTAEKRP